jgi:hypothetical protein
VEQVSTEGIWGGFESEKWEEESTLTRRGRMGHEFVRTNLSNIQ